MTLTTRRIGVLKTFSGLLWSVLSQVVLQSEETPTVTFLVTTTVETMSDVEQKGKEPPTESLGPVGHEAQI